MMDLRTLDPHKRLEVKYKLYVRSIIINIMQES